MGTDIHLRLEARTAEGWHGIPPCWPSWPYPKNEQGEIICPKDDPTERNYDVFAFLAGVRNGYGSAGCYRHELVRPAFPNRGLPVDSDYEDHYAGQEDGDSYDDVDDVWLGDHSFTWATIAELQALDWEIEFESGGYVSAETYENLPAGAMPDMWIGGKFGDYLQILEPEDYESRKATNDLDKNTEYWVFVSWKWKPLLESSFYKWLKGDRLAAVIRQYGLDNLRLLMSFDS